MIVEINDGQFEFECNSFNYILLGQGGVNLEFTFTEIPDIIRKFAVSGLIIKNIKVYKSSLLKYKKYMPIYSYVAVTRTVHREELFKVYMEALRVIYPSGSINRICSNPRCNQSIHYLYVMFRLLDIVDDETANNIWNSKLTEFYCCYCYEKKFHMEL